MLLPTGMVEQGGDGGGCPSRGHQDHQLPPVKIFSGLVFQNRFAKVQQETGAGSGAHSDRHGGAGGETVANQAKNGTHLSDQAFRSTIL
ncbi:MAG: hypothetical protein H7839_20580 [Magnetococcus sp. YQC-5]